MTNKTDLINIDSPDFFTVKIIDGVTYTAFAYDANGNTTHDGRTGQDLAWNLLNLIPGVSKTVSGTTSPTIWAASGRSQTQALVFRSHEPFSVMINIQAFPRQATKTISAACSRI